MAFKRRTACLVPLGAAAALWLPGRVLADDALSAEAPPSEVAAELVAEPALEPPADPALALINAYRAAAGAPAAALHGALMNSAVGQVQYYDLNRGDPSLAGMGLHQQKPDRPGFTGASMGDRAKNAGYGGGSVTENAGFGTIRTAIEWAIGTVNHRLPLIHPNAVDMGYAVSGGPSGNGFNIIDVGLRRERLSVALPSVYPGDGAWDVPTSWDGGETPDPAPGVPRPLGYPITVAFGVMQRVEWRELMLFGPTGEPLPVSTPLTDWMRAAAIIPHRPLLRGQTYTAHVAATVDGRPVERDWQFTTR
jgi:hypothetical protein